MLRIFADKKLLLPGVAPVIMLYPFWGAPKEDSISPDYGRFDDYIAHAKDHITIVDTVQEADAVVLPFEYSFESSAKKIATEQAQLAARYHKPLLVFYNNDDATPIELENAIIFRTSGYQSKKAKNEFGFPAWSADFLKKYFNNTVTPSTPSLPAVSYCGYIDYRNTIERFRFFIQSLRPALQQQATGKSLRGKAIRALAATPGINTHFILRNRFWTGDEGQSQQQAREQYAQNIVESPYSLAVRGAGNFSYRLYEILSCGRIPLFINTDCILPFDGFIDWKGICLFIEEKDLPEMGSHVINFHKYLSPAELAAKQLAARKLYEEWLSPTGFFKNIYRYLQYQPA
jgi:hypothetical protein